MAEDNGSFPETTPLGAQPTIVPGQLVEQNTEGLPRVSVSSGPSTEQWVAHVARGDAEDFLAETLRDLSSDTFLVFNELNAEGVAKSRGRDCMLHVQSEYPQKINEIYMRAFVGFLVDTRVHGPYANRFLSEDEWLVQQIVRKDKDEGWLEKSQGDHQRDLAVLRAQEALSITSLTESLDRLKEIHTWVDNYELACRETKNGMVWPPANYFRLG